MTGLGVASTIRARIRARAHAIGAVSTGVLALATLAAAAGGEDVAPLAGISTFLGSLLIFALVAGGWVGRELHSGAALFWIQTPRLPLLLYSVRFGAVTGTALLWTTGLCGATSAVLAGLGRTDAAAEVLLRVPGLLLGLLALGGLIWLAGGWGVRGDGWAGLLSGVGLTTLELVARLQPGLLGPLATPADVLGLPLDDLADGAALLAGAGGSVGALGRVAFWIAALAVGGSLGVVRIAGRPSGEHSDG